MRAVDLLDDQERRSTRREPGATCPLDHRSEAGQREKACLGAPDVRELVGEGVARPASLPVVERGGIDRVTELDRAALERDDVRRDQELVDREGDGRAR